MRHGQNELYILLCHWQSRCQHCHYSLVSADVQNLLSGSTAGEPPTLYHGSSYWSLPFEALAACCNAGGKPKL